MTGCNNVNDTKIDDHVQYILQNFSMAEADMIASSVLEYIEMWVRTNENQDREE